MLQTSSLFCDVLSHSISPTVCNPMDCSSPGSSVHGDSPGKNTGVGCCALPQGIFQTQGLNPGLPYCRQILYHMSHQGSPWEGPNITQYMPAQVQKSDCRIRIWFWSYIKAAGSLSILPPGERQKSYPYSRVQVNHLQGNFIFPKWLGEG